MSILRFALLTVVALVAVTLAGTLYVCSQLGAPMAACTTAADCGDEVRLAPLTPFAPRDYPVSYRP